MKNEQKELIEKLNNGTPIYLGRHAMFEQLSNDEFKLLIKALESLKESDVPSGEYYKKIEIHSDSDMPKESGMYECLFSDNTLGRATFDITDQFASTGVIWWINKVKWYLRPYQMPEKYPDTEADGIVFCGKCGKMK
jgi:hypothetical protein